MNTVEEHFKNKSDNVSAMYNELLKELRKFGKVTENPNKSSIHLLNKYGFAGVYTRKDYILLHIHLSNPLENKRIKKVEQISKNRFIHTVKLTSIADIDEELLSWLKSAYDLKG